MPLLFSYGTLQEQGVQLTTFGRLLRGQSDELPGFEPSQVRIEDPEVVAASGKTHHANVTFNGRNDSRVTGTVFEVSDDELAAADRYEQPAAYKRIAATLASGKQAWVYVEARSAPGGPVASVVDGDLLDQPVDVIVNPWNRNVLPWWLLLPQGVSGAIKRRAGLAPFQELAKAGPIPLGGAVLTGAGRLPFQGIIHVAGMDLLWRASERSVAESVRSALRLARRHSFRSVAFPVIGAGTGGLGEERALGCMRLAVQDESYQGRVVIVRFRQDRS